MRLALPVKHAPLKGEQARRFDLRTERFLNKSLKDKTKKNLLFTFKNTVTMLLFEQMFECLSKFQI